MSCRVIAVFVLLATFFEQGKMYIDSECGKRAEQQAGQVDLTGFNEGKWADQKHQKEQPNRGANPESR